MNYIKKYYSLIKPGIVYGNLISMIAGYLFASHLHIYIVSFIGASIGVYLIIASACVINNYIDRGIDAKMSRTKERSIVAGIVKPMHALIFGIVLGSIGFIVLIATTNILTVTSGLIGFFVYIVVYAFAKRATIYNTIIGSISGAMPILAGYTAVTNRLDMAALLIFLMMAIWQMPHFYAISIYRLQDYTEAGVILWPIKKGVQNTKWQIFVFIIAFLIASLLLYVFGYKGIIYAILITLMSLVWVWQSIEGFRTKNETRWAKTLFLSSLIYLFFMCILIALPSI